MNASVQFSGFPQATFAFLRELAQHNNREWYGAHQEQAEQCLFVPAAQFIQTFGKAAQKIYPELLYDTRTNGSGSLFRLNRDTRFAKDKSPYKTNLGFRFWMSEAERRAKRVRLYVHLDQDGITIYGGEHCQLEPAAIGVLREHIHNDKQGKLRGILAQLEKAGFVYSGETLARVPAGYAADHPDSELLRRKSLFMASPTLSPANVGTPTLIGQCVAHAKSLKPLNDWLVDQ